MPTDHGRRVTQPVLLRKPTLIWTKKAVQHFPALKEARKLARHAVSGFVSRNHLSWGDIRISVVPRGTQRRFAFNQPLRSWLISRVAPRLKHRLPITSAFAAFPGSLFSSPVFPAWAR